MKTLLIGLLTLAPAFAQGWYPHHNISFGMGAGQPRGDLRAFFDNAFGLEIGYGYRFHRYFQADVGFETVFGAAGIHDFLPTGIGDLRIRDYQFLVPLGGRAIAPLANGRLEFYGGGGGAYMRYQERLHQPSEFLRVDCPVCASRDGWGWYGTLGANIALDRGRHFRLGAGSKVYRGHTSGDPLGAVPALRTRDHWVNVFAELTFAF